MFWVSRASLGLARRKRLALVVMSGSTVCLQVSVFCFYIFIIDAYTKHTGMNAPPSGLPIPDPYCITSSVCLLIAQSHCPNHFVLHDSRRDRLPRFPCLLPTPCERGTHVLLADCLRSWVAESVENVLHVAGLPDRCMTSSHLTRVQPNLLSRRCLALLCF